MNFFLFVLLVIAAIIAAIIYKNRDKIRIHPIFRSWILRQKLIIDIHNTGYWKQNNKNCTVRPDIVWKRARKSDLTYNGYYKFVDFLHGWKYIGTECYVRFWNMRVFDVDKWNSEHPNEEDKLNDIFRTNQPEIVATPRFGSMKHGDIKVYECSVNNYDVENVWETCERIAHCWGWTPETQPRSLRDLVKLLIKVITGGGNLLLNVGPDGSGKMDEKQVRRLLELGDFVNKYEESIFNTDAGPIVNGNYGGTTHNKNSVYLHITDWKCEEASFPTLNEKVKKVECLTSTDGFKYHEENGVLYMNVDEKSKGDPDTIFKITFEKDVKEIFKDFDAHSFKIDTPYVDRFTEINGR